MNKILTLYHIEFKRIYKLFIALLGFLFGGNLWIIGSNLFRVVKNVADGTKSKFSISLLKSSQGKSMLLDGNIRNIFNVTNLLLGLVVIFVLLYAVAIWYRDFIGKSKTSYTLFMLPTNKFNIYISKLITVVMMVYSVMLMQMLCWVIGLYTISGLSNLKVSQIIALFSGKGIITRDLLLIQVHTIDFFMINILGVILATVVIFTGVMIQKSYRKIGVFLGVVYIGLSILIYVLLTSLAIRYSDILLLVHGIYYILLFVISMTISYNLINKKVYV